MRTEEQLHEVKELLDELAGEFKTPKDVQSLYPPDAAFQVIRVQIIKKEQDNF
jgi:hypothetical protein